MAKTMCPDMNLSNPRADDSPAGIQDKEDVFLQRDLGSTYATKEFSKLFRETKLKVFEARAHNARVIKKCIRYFRSKGAAAIATHNAFIVATKSSVPGTDFLATRKMDDASVNNDFWVGQAEPAQPFGAGLPSRASAVPSLRRTNTSFQGGSCPAWDC